MVESEAVKSLLQSFRTAEEALATAEVPTDKKGDAMKGRIHKLTKLVIYQLKAIYSTVSYRPGSFM